MKSEVGTFTGSIIAPVLGVGKHFHRVAYAFCVRCYSRSLELGGDYTIELGVSRDLKAFLKIKTMLQVAQFGYNDWNFLY
jgi:hypothetical protein